MIKKELFSNVLTLAWNLLLVYVCYTLCRLAFLFVNWDTFSGNLSWGYTISLLGAGIIFDTTAILYSNALFILLFLLPLHWKETPSFYKGVRWIFTIVNTFFLITNLIDCVYFRFSGRRTTMTVFQEFKNEGEGNLASIFLDEFISYWYLVVFAALLSYAIYKLYRSPQNFPVKQKLSYYCGTVGDLIDCNSFYGIWYAWRDDYSNSSYNLEQCQSVRTTSFRCRIGIEHTFFLVPYIGKDHICNT